MRHPEHARGAPGPLAGRSVAALKDFGLLAGLDPGELCQFAARCAAFCIPAHNAVFEEGDPSEGLWVLASGRARIHHLIPDGRRQVVAFCAPGDPLDLVSGIDGRPYSATATTMEASEIALIPRDLVVELGRRFPVVAANALDLLSRDVRQRDITTAIATLAGARGRIGCALMQLAFQFGVTGHASISIDYRLTRQDIADRAGTTVETAIRVMSELQQRGAIQTTAQQIDLLDVGYIREMIGCADCQFECSMFAPVVIPPSSI